MKNKLYLLILILLPFASFAQIIPLTNPSFEDTPSHSKIPTGWHACGFPNESPPDIHPDPAFTFQVSQTPYDGNTYLGMVVRDNNSWESITQALPAPMEVDSCYTFSLHAARSKNYISSSRVTDQMANYNTPVIIEIYGGFDLCDFKKRLAVTAPIVNYNWEAFTFNFKPKEAYTHIIITAYYQNGTKTAYNGNVLIDKLQFIKGCGEMADFFIANDTTTRIQPPLFIYTPPKVNINTSGTPLYQGKVPNISQAKDLPLRRTKDLPLQFVQPVVQLDTFLAALPTTMDALKEEIIKHGASIQFHNVTHQLENHYFTFQKLEYYGVNKYLTFIARAMQQFPDYRLIISVELKGMNRQKRMMSLYNQLIDLGMEENYFLITPFKKSDEDLYWLFHSNTNGLRMQITPIK